MTAAGAARDGAAVPSPTPPLSPNWGPLPHSTSVPELGDPSPQPQRPWEDATLTITRDVGRCLLSYVTR